MRAHRRARERQADRDAIGRLDERIRKLAAHLRLRRRAQPRVDAAALVGLEEHARAVGATREGRSLAAGQRERQRPELRPRRQRRTKPRPVDRLEAGPRHLVDADQPIVAAARAGLLTREDDVVGQYQIRHSATVRGIAAGGQVTKAVR